MPLPGIRTTDDRVGKYTAKTDPAAVGLKIAAQLPGMSSRYTGYANEMEGIEAAVNVVLDAVGTLSMLTRGAYHAFSKVTWRLTKSFSGAFLVAQAQAIKDTWVDRGLDDDVCKDIALDVFSLTLT